MPACSSAGGVPEWIAGDDDDDDEDDDDDGDEDDDDDDDDDEGDDDDDDGDDDDDNSYISFIIRNIFGGVPNIFHKPIKFSPSPCITTQDGHRLRADAERINATQRNLGSWWVSWKCFRRWQPQEEK